MEQFVGLDVSQQQTHVCVVDRDGVALWRGTCASSPAEIAAVINEKAPSALRVGLETGPLATWHWHALKALGLPVICIDARHAKAVLSMQINKTDRNDAYPSPREGRSPFHVPFQEKSCEAPLAVPKARR